MLEEMLQQQIIRPSKSSFASPIVLVRKKDNTLRLCIDYRRLNDRTRKDSFPLPRIEETLEALHGAAYFTTLDLAHGYFQVVMAEDSVDKTAFRVPWGLYEFERMPQGLTNSPSTFQRIMEYILGDMNLSEIVLYLDDVLVFSKTLDEHLNRLDRVLSRLRSHGLKVKGKKCSFLRRQVTYLGHVVSEAGVAVDQDKIQRICTWPTPSSVSEVRSFLGLASYYRRFIAGFSKMAGPLHALTGKAVTQAGKGNDFHWGVKEDEAFNELKSALTTTPVLAYPNFDRNFILEIDASYAGLGACLLQQDDNGKIHPVAYASRGLRGAERNYSDMSSFKIELLALKWAVTEKFGPYLQGSHTVVWTDHNPLAHLKTANLGATEMRWVAQLSQYDLEVKYRPGRTNKCADALSRCPGNASGTEIKSALQETASCLTLQVSRTDEDTNKCNVEPCVLPSFTHDELATMQQKDEVLHELRKMWDENWIPGEDFERSISGLKSWIREWQKFRMNKGVLYRIVTDPVLGSVNQLLVPATLRTTLIEMVHDKWGHQGVTRTFELLRRRCFWPGMHHDVKKHVQRCFRCVTTKPPTPTIRPPMRHLLAFRPQEILAVDFLKLDGGFKGYEDVLVMTDIFSKFSQAVPCRDQTALTVAKMLRDHWFVHYGVPGRIHSDRGGSFENAIIHELCAMYGIKKSRTTAYHPAGNGQCERFNKTLCGLIRSLDPSERRRWPELMQHVLYMYNTTPHRVTGVCPYFLMFGRQPSIPIDHLLNRLDGDWNEEHTQMQDRLMQKAHQVVADRLREAARREAERHDRKATDPVLEIGERVLLKRNAFTGRHKLEDKYFEVPHIIVNKNEESDLYEVRPVLGGASRWVNRRQLIIDPRERDQEVLQDVLPDFVQDTECELDQHETQSNEVLHEDEIIHDDNDDDDHDDYHDPFQWMYSTPQGDSSESTSGSGLRRSDRVSKGVNPNPGRLPVSSVTGLPDMSLSG